MVVSGNDRKHDTGSAGPHRILVVDDEGFMRDLLREVLTLEGYELEFRQSDISPTIVGR